MHRRSSRNESSKLLTLVILCGLFWVVGFAGVAASMDTFVKAIAVNGLVL